MGTAYSIRRAVADDALDVSVLVSELVCELAEVADSEASAFDLASTVAILKDFLERERYFAFVARTGNGVIAGFIGLYESRGGPRRRAYGSISELYVRPRFREQGLGLRLVEEAKSFGHARGWTWLEVTTPPVPPFERTVAFYQREGFSVRRGQKLEVALMASTGHAGR